jgi:hypothetical protein
MARYSPGHFFLTRDTCQLLAQHADADTIKAPGLIHIAALDNLLVDLSGLFG